MTPAAARHQFLRLSALFMGGMALFTEALSLIAGVRPLKQLNVSPGNFLIGLLAALAMLIALWWARQERHLARQTLGEYLVACRWWELLLLAAVVGFCEEWLFRGVLQSWWSRWHPWGAVLLVNLVFGLLHAISIRYAVLAGTLGVALSLLAFYPGEPSLFRPMVAHGAYDFIAFLVVAQDHRRWIANLRRASPPQA